MQELFPDLSPEDWPVFQEVTKDAVYFLTKKRAFPLKPMPPNFRNHGNYVTSVAKLGRFLASGLLLSLALLDRAVSRQARRRQAGNSHDRAGVRHDEGPGCGQHRR